MQGHPCLDKIIILNFERIWRSHLKIVEYGRRRRRKGKKCDGFQHQLVLYHDCHLYSYITINATILEFWLVNLLWVKKTNSNLNMIMVNIGSHYSQQILGSSSFEENFGYLGCSTLCTTYLVSKYRVKYLGLAFQSIGFGSLLTQFIWIIS